MDYYKMIASENTDSMYEKWSEYRNELTDYIIEGIEHLHIRRKLADTGKRRIYGEYNIETIVAEKVSRPTLAIWGAGGCNDIDIVRLAKYFKLILIDYNVDMIKSARDRFGLTEDECLCVDLHFWDISDEDYLMYEALLRDRAKVEEISDFLNELSDKIHMPDYESLPKFDYSVVVGLASQLNSRFAAILHMMMYEAQSENDDTSATIYSRDELSMLQKAVLQLNRVAVNCLLDAVMTMTKHGFVTGHELYTVSADEETDVRNQIGSMNETAEISMIEGNCDFVMPEHRSTISGNDVFEENVRNLVNNEKELIVVNNQAMLWPFADGKSYLMLMNILEKTINKTL